MHSTPLILECRCVQIEEKVDKIQETLIKLLKMVDSSTAPLSFPAASSTVIEDDLESILSSFCSERPQSIATVGRSTNPSPSLFSPTFSPPFLYPNMPMNPSRVRACSAPPTISKGGDQMANSWESASYFDPDLQLVQEITEPTNLEASGGSHPGGLLLQPSTNPEASGGSHPGELLLQPSGNLEASGGSYSGELLLQPSANPEASGGSHPGGHLWQPSAYPEASGGSYSGELLLQPSGNPEASGGSHPGGLLSQPSANLEASGGSHPGGLLRQLPSDKDALARPKFSRSANVFSSVSPRRYLSADQVMAKYARYKNRRDVGRLAIALAKCTYFGAATMADSTVTGRGDTAALDPTKLQQLKANIRSIFPTMSDAEFEAIWGLCVTSIASACKNLRKQKLAGTL